MRLLQPRLRPLSSFSTGKREHTMPPQKTLADSFGGKKRPAVVEIAAFAHKKAATECETCSAGANPSSGGQDGSAFSRGRAATSSLSPVTRSREKAVKQAALLKEAEEAAAEGPSAPAEGGSAPCEGGLSELLLEPTWKQALAPELRKSYFRQLDSFWRAESRKHKVYPEPQDIFRALNSCSLASVRVVILGQDPYHNDGQAMGLSFSVPKGQPVPSSLKNIYKELSDDVGFMPPTHGCLQQWAVRGVLLLNASLTVEAHKANSHAKAGWAPFTDAVIRELSASRKGLVFLLWGKFAEKKAALVDKSRHHLLTAAHPSGLSAARGFFGCKHFSQANEWLKREGLPPVDWQIV